MMFRFDWFSGEGIAKKVVGDKSYIEALSFARNYKPKPETDYGWVMDYADSEYKRLEDTLNFLDSKADSLIRYMGAGSGIIALVFTYVLSVNTWWSAVQVLPTLIMFFISMAYAGRARAPEKMPTPLHTAGAIKYAHAYPASVARASFAAMTGTAAIGLNIAITEKARLVRWAFRWFIYGVFWLVLIAIISVISLNLSKR